jgi:hypothetical protein
MVWGYILAVIFGGYLLPHLLLALAPSQNLKKKARAPARAAA